MTPPPRLHLHALTLHHERLRGFVIALLRDEHAAADVLQETWVRALSKAPREPKALGAWLRTMARRLALNERRGRRRRARREVESARSGALPSSAEVAARVEIQRRVVEVLEGLAEPHRTLLRDRYFGDLTPTEIARRDGSSLNTVKDRLRRARAAMRAALERHGLTKGDDLRWSLIVPPSMRPPRPALIGSSLLMKKTAVIAVVALAAAVLWGVAARGPEGAAHPVAGSAPAQIPLATLRDTDALPSPDLRLDAERTVGEVREPGPAERNRDWVVRGRVRVQGESGGEVPRLRLGLILHEGYEASGERLAAREVESDAHGRFAWALADPGRTVTIVLEPFADPALSIRTPQPCLAVAGEGPPESIVVLVARRDAWIEGTVRAAHGGAPIEGARVAYNDVTAPTDARGEYRLQVPSRGYGAVIVSASGYDRAGRSPGGLASGATTIVDVDLEPEPAESVVFGVVRGEDGAFLEGAVVRCGSAQAEARTDVTGHYRLRGIELDPIAYVAIEASAQGYAKGTEYLTQGPGGPPTAAGTQLDFVLTRGARVEGRVIDARGRAVPGARLWLGPIAMLVNNRATHSRDDGRFVFDAVPPGRTKLGVTKRGLAETVLDLHVPASPSGPMQLEVVLEDAATLRGTVLDDRGEPVAGARIRATPALDPGELSASRGRVAGTDPDGRFELVGVPRQALQLHVTGLGIVGRSVVVAHDERDLTLVVSRASRIAGRVIDAATRQPIEKFSVRLLPTSDESLGPWFSGIEGSWLYGGRAFSSIQGTWSTDDKDPIRAGAWTAVEVEAPGYELLRFESVQVPAVGVTEELLCALVAE